MYPSIIAELPTLVLIIARCPAAASVEPQEGVQPLVYLPPAFLEKPRVGRYLKEIRLRGDGLRLERTDTGF